MTIWQHSEHSPREATFVEKNEFLEFVERFHPLPPLSFPACVTMKAPPLLHTTITTFPNLSTSNDCNYISSHSSLHNLSISPSLSSILYQTIKMSNLTSTDPGGDSTYDQSVSPPPQVPLTPHLSNRITDTHPNPPPSPPPPPLQNPRANSAVNPLLTTSKPIRRPRNAVSARRRTSGTVRGSARVGWVV